MGHHRLSLFTLGIEWELKVIGLFHVSNFYDKNGIKSLQKSFGLYLSLCNVPNILLPQ